jgi:hypothetical protein
MFVRIERRRAGQNVSFGGLTLDFDVAVEAATSTSTVFYVVATSPRDGGGVVGCSFGLNVDVQGTAVVYATDQKDLVDGGTGFIESTAQDVLGPKLQHVTFRWTSGPPKIEATIDQRSFSISPPDCARASDFVLAFGLQSPTTPIEARMHIDNVVYAFSP